MADYFSTNTAQPAGHALKADEISLRIRLRHRDEKGAVSTTEIDFERRVPAENRRPVREAVADRPDQSGRLVPGQSSSTPHLRNVFARITAQLECLNRMKHFLSLLCALAVASISVAAESPAPAAPNLKTAVFAGGCFWCIQPAFDKAPGVVKTIVGYAGGTEPNPTYELVTSEKTQYRESLEITYDPAKISYDQLLDIYWKQINPTQADGQFTDIGPSYRAAIFAANDDEKKIAEASKAKLAASGRFDKPIVTEILSGAKFWPAEDYHQKYYQTNSMAFEMFELASGRKSFAKKKGSEEKK